MALTDTQIRSRYKSPQKRSVVSRAVRNEQALKFHVETHADISEISQPANKFLAWVSSLIPVDKYELFTQLFRFPLATNDLIARIFTDLSRVLDGRNRNINYNFTTPELLEDWISYFDSEKWKVEAWEKMKSAINSIMVIDLPTEQNTFYAAPYLYWLDMQNVVDFDMAGDRITWLLFRRSDGNVSYYDEQTYRVYSIGKQAELGEIIIDNPHALGYCPAQFFWSTPINISEPALKASRLTNLLYKLDWLLFFSVSKQALDLYAPYPIYSGYEQACDYSDLQLGHQCIGGLLRDNLGGYVMNGMSPVKCPVCSGKRIVGVGSYIEIPAPKDDNDGKVIDMRNPITITTVDIESLNYNRDEVSRLEDSIFDSAVGKGGEGINDKAVNEKQVVSNYENRTTVLNSLKANFEKARTWTIETMCWLRYAGGFVSVYDNWGTEFYIATTDDLRLKYKNALAGGASMSELDAIEDQIIESEYRTNPRQLQRMKILKAIEPLRHYSNQEIVTMLDKRAISLDEYQLKINFSIFVAKFERENMDVVEFGKLLSYDKKIEAINETLKRYVTEQNAGWQA
ncbi:MAG: hypothetical protein ACOYMF_05975 [Bacteroidales bacterium]